VCEAHKAVALLATVASVAGIWGTPHPCIWGDVGNATSLYLGGCGERHIHCTVQCSTCALGSKQGRTTIIIRQCMHHLVQQVSPCRHRARVCAIPDPHSDVGRVLPCVKAEHTHAHVNTHWCSISLAGRAEVLDQLEV
jgi:hypothetical protein